MNIDSIKRAFIQIKMLSIRNGWKKAEYLKKKNVFHHIGEHCFYQSTILPAEPFLVSLHNNVAISAGVRLITHSAAHVVYNYEEDTDEYICRHDKIEIHDNVYIGADVIINMGVTIGSNVIIAAGSIVTHDIPDNSVVAGVPAKIIGTYEDTKAKHKLYSEQYTSQGLKEPCTVAQMIELKPIEFDDNI
jgi:acetyltransferase-like isoleucine patch superfamily enzyme